MATATLTKIPPPPPEPIKHVTLNLSYQEALVIVDLCGHVAGVGPRRACATIIYNALIDAGVEGAYERGISGSDLLEPRSDYRHAITFKGENVYNHAKD
jgi:hypothetical protein